MYKRAYYHQLRKRIDEPRRFIQVLTGPRQVGKTTLINQLLDEHKIPSIYESADGQFDNTGLWISNVWERARLQLRSKGYSEILLCLDEVQKIPQWSEHVKREWDHDTKEKYQIKVVLLGSSRLLLQEGLTESLAGRYETILMSHWKYAEMKMAFGMKPEEFVFFGGYPGAVDLIEDEERWKNYIRDSLLETAISRDIFMMKRINKPALLKRLFELAALYSGQIISYTKMLGQLQDAGNTVTLAHYLELIDIAGLIKGINKFSIQPFRQRASSPKFQVYNTAISCSYSVESFMSVRENPELWGRLVESSVGAHLLNHMSESGFKVFYWRDRSREVDFILKKDKKLIAIEVKSGRQKPVKGLEEFSKLYKPEKSLIVGSGGIPWSEFLETDPGDLF
ncbi:MAG: ATP-binding protein [Bacteroidota bacterium]